MYCTFICILMRKINNLSIIVNPAPHIHRSDSSGFSDDILNMRQYIVYMGGMLIYYKY